MPGPAHVERGTDPTQYRTYSWGPADVQATGDPRLDNNPFFGERAGGNQTQAAQLLGINRDQVRYRIEKLGLQTTRS